jgi:hypothetical protein
VKLRSSLLLVPVVAGLSIGALAPVQAAPTDAVTDLTLGVAQVAGAHDSWRITASWTAESTATAYGVLIADHADGTVTAGKAYANQDTRSSRITLTSSRLVADHDYWVVVQPIAPESGDATIAKFHTPELDTTPPSGAYRLDRTSTYLTSTLFSGDLADLFSGGGATADFLITQSSLAGAVSRTVVAGDGTSAKSWTSGSSFTLTYTRAGAFTPHVRLTDQYANTRDIALPTVRVLADVTGPSVRITAPAKPGRIASWRVVRGTATDAGSGVTMVVVALVEKRGATWWVYDTATKKWLEGYASRKKTERKTKATCSSCGPPPPVPGGPRGSRAWRRAPCACRRSPSTARTTWPRRGR